MPTDTELWIRADDRKNYEQYIFGTLQRRFKGARIIPNAHLPGLKSGRDRQIDVLVELNIGGCDLKIAFDCKCYKRKVNVKHVESFLGMLDDIRVSQGVLVTAKGYTEAAYKRARHEPRDIDLQILDPARLSEYQFVGCLWLWKAGVAAVVEPPNGWVVDIENQVGPFQFSMYPLGHHRESAMKGCPFLYGAIVLKTETTASIEAIAAEDERIVTTNYPMAKFEYITSSLSKDPEASRETLLRVGHVDPSYGGPEYSLYIDIPKGVLRLVLLCPSGKGDVYLPVLEWVGRGAVTMSRNDEESPSLTLEDMNAVGCSLFPLGFRQSILESKDRELQVID
jgi:hypothetical protein